MKSDSMKTKYAAENESHVVRKYLQRENWNGGKMEQLIIELIKNLVK